MRKKRVSGTVVSYFGCLYKDKAKQRQNYTKIRTIFFHHLHFVKPCSGGSRISRSGGVDPLGGRGPPTCSGGSRISHWGSTDPLGGGTNLQCIHFSAKTYAKTKEMDPFGGAHAGGAPPGSTNDVGTFH